MLRIIMSDMIAFVIVLVTFMIVCTNAFIILTSADHPDFNSERRI